MLTQHVAFGQAEFRAFLCLLLAWVTVSAPNPPPPKQDDVVRVYTELVQTDVMVFDKQGRFVNGLKRENFELKKDGKLKPLESFDEITAGSDEEAQLAAARGATTINTKRPVPLDRGRTVFFYVDDFHMDLSGMVTPKKVISTFLDKEMGQNDQAAISSATGQIGFLQQLTNDRAVLQTALERLNVRSYSVRDADRPPMSEYEALLLERGDFDVNEFFIAETIRQNPGMTREMASSIVRGRAQAINAQAGQFTMNTLIGLDRLIRGLKELPGRKVVFFLSNGIFLENRRSDSLNKVREVTSAAAKSGVVIYTMDTRGLVVSLQDASSDRAFDPTGRLEMATHGEQTATQEALNTLARYPGRRPIMNTNDLTKGLKPAIKETSTYYLLAWKPETQGKQGRFRNIEVNVIGRPDLTVRVRKGFFDVAPPSNTAATKSTAPTEATKTAAATLRETIKAAYPERNLPILVTADYFDVAGRGAVLSTSVQTPGEFLVFGEQPDGKVQAILDLAGVFLDDKGLPQANFTQRIVTTAPSLEASKSYTDDITYSYPAKLTPGLYQVRVAAHDEKSGRSGSAHAWVRIPDLTKKELTASSLLVGERTPAMVSNVSNANALSPIAINVSRRFHRDSKLRFLVFAYNTAPSPTDQKPDVAVQVQIVRDDQPVITTALRKINTEGVTDLARLPYAADVQLGDLQPGRYVLHVTVIDRVVKKSFSRETPFEVY